MGVNRTIRRDRKDHRFSSYTLELLSLLRPMLGHIKPNGTSIFDLWWFKAISRTETSTPSFLLLSMVVSLVSFAPFPFPSAESIFLFGYLLVRLVFSQKLPKASRWFLANYPILAVAVDPRLIPGCENKSANACRNKETGQATNS